MTEEQLVALSDSEQSAAFTELEKLLYAGAMTQTPVDVPDELFQQLQEHFGPRQLVELTSPLRGRITALGSTMRSGSRRKVSSRRVLPITG